MGTGACGRCAAACACGVSTLGPSSSRFVWHSRWRRRVGVGLRHRQGFPGKSCCSKVPFCAYALQADNVEKALGFWVGRSLHICFRVWRQFAANQLRKNEAVQKAVGHWAGKSLRACFEVWREFTMLQQHKVGRGDYVQRGHFWLLRPDRQLLTAITPHLRPVQSVATARALRHWTGTTLRSCFALWRLLVEDAHSNWDQATQHLM